MKTLTALVVILACVTAQAKKQETKKPKGPAADIAPIAATATPPAPNVDPGKEHKLAGIITADIGVGVLVAGIIMLSITTIYHDHDHIETRRGLDLGGGLAVGVGGTAMITGFLIWMVGRQETKAWKAKQKAWLISPVIGRDGGGAAFQLRF
jgi:hypothetical protein